MIETKRMHMERQFLEHGFGPFFRPDSELLILGSFPSVKSREANFFYGHPQNRFWPLLARLTGEDVPDTLEKKYLFLERNHIALYDVIERCSIIGSSDNSIRNVEPANLLPILEGSRICENIYANGSTAFRLYQVYLLQTVGIQAKKLPSTSPANAAYSLDKLEEIWAKTLNISPRR